MLILFYGFAKMALTRQILQKITADSNVSLLFISCILKINAVLLEYIHLIGYINEQV